MTVYVSILNTRSTDYRQRAGLPKENTPKHFRKYMREWTLHNATGPFKKEKPECDE